MFEKNLVIGEELTKKYVEGLSYEERNSLIEPIFNKFREMGFIFPNSKIILKKEYDRLCKKQLDISQTEVFNNSNVGTYICKFFCKSFFYTSEIKKGVKTPNMVDFFNDDDVLKRIIRNRLGMEWYKQKGENDVEAFNISPKQIVQGMRSTRTVIATSMFKPAIARFIYEKFSNKGDVVYDYSMGFGGRLLGAMVSDRRYIGVDPLTSKELEEMKSYFKFTNCELINGCSEDYNMGKNTIDLAFSSPPYYNKEAYSEDKSQAYNKGEDYFYNIYWSQTLKNIKEMLKHSGYFILNVDDNYPKMLEMANDKFNMVEKISLRTIRSHLTKKAGIEKFEGVYVFKK